MHIRLTQFAATLAVMQLLFVATACAGSDNRSSAQDTPEVATTNTPLSIDDGWATPIILPVTPGPVPEHTILDPAFKALPGTRAFSGIDDSGPMPHSYQIEVPDVWNGDVVYYAHGFRGNGTELTVSPPPIREHLVSNGYAWAASSYAQNGYRPGIGARDTARLISVFERLVGTPDRSFIYGQSMGGNVVTLSLENPATRPAYDGAISECGAMTASGIVDYFLSWGAIAGFLTDTDLTNVATDAGEFVITVRDVVNPALGPPDDPTSKGDAFANAILHLTGGPRPFFDEGFAAQYANNFAILFSAIVSPSPSNAVAQNADTVYEVDDGLIVSSEAINSQITRVQANPEYRDPDLYPEFSPATGKIGVPLLSIHNTGDLFVPIHLQQQYRRIVDAAGAGDLLVQRAIARSGHCNFTSDERIAAFADLVAWVEDGEVPDGEDLLADLTNAGAAFTIE
jgi:dienelactone hydrolase